MKTVTIKKRGLKLDYLNKNDRIYTLESVKKCIPEFIKKVNNNLIYGCFFGDVEDTQVPLSKISHKINNVFIENNTFKVEITVLDTPHGKILQNMIENNIYFNLAPISLSIIRGKYVDINELITFNIVTEDNDAFLSLSDIRKIKLEKINKNK